MRSPAVEKMPRVALLLETSREVGRGILRGILRYERLHGPWGLHVIPGDLEQTLPAMRAWGGTGIIARITTPEIARTILASRLPAIAVDLWKDQLHRSNPLSKLPELYVDSYAVGQMAAEHLLERAFRHYAFVGELHGVLWSERREKGFRDRLTAAGFGCHLYPQPAPDRRDWGLEQAGLGRWLKALPKPVGVMAAMDIRGRQVLDACLEAGVRVPEDIAVIGVDNDQLLCELSEPPMSSVALDTERGGYEAAELLHQLMRRKTRWPMSRPRRILIEPTRVVARRSTDALIVSDMFVAEALRFIRLNACRPISVWEVTQHIGISRRILEIRFSRVTGRSILTEILRVRLDRVKVFLQETDLTTQRIAEECGFGSGNYLGKVFRRTAGITMGQYRTQMRRSNRERTLAEV